MSLKGNKRPYKLSGFIKIKEGQTSSELGKDSLTYIYPSSFLKNINKKNDVDNFVFEKFLAEGKDLKFSNKNLNFNVNGRVYLSGDVQNPLLEGRVNIAPESTFEFQTNKFYITRGILTYNKDLSDNPRVFILAYTPIDTGKNVLSH